VQVFRNKLKRNEKRTRSKKGLLTAKTVPTTPNKKKKSVEMSTGFSQVESKGWFGHNQKGEGIERPW